MLWMGSSNFPGPASWAALGKSEAEVAALAVPDKLEQRGRQVGSIVQERGGNCLASVCGEWETRVELWVSGFCSGSSKRGHCVQL